MNIPGNVAIFFPGVSKEQIPTFYNVWDMFFQNVLKTNLKFPKVIMFYMIWLFHLIIWGVLVSANVNIIVFGAHGHVQKAQNQ